MAKCLSRLCLIVSLVSCGSSVLALQPCDEVLPETTVAVLSIRDVAEARTAFSKTQLGELLREPSMEKFLIDLSKQLRAKVANGGTQLGITLSDLEGVANGEACFARVQPKFDKQQHASVMLVDVTGKEDAAKALLEKIATDMTANQATQSSTTLAGTSVTVYTRRNDIGAEVKSYFVLNKGALLISNHSQVLTDMLQRLATPNAENTLSTSEAYTETLQKCEQDAGDQPPHLRFFINPFRVREVNAASQGFPKRKGVDIVKVLSQQGFEAVKGIGGSVHFATGEHEVAYRAFVYAPATASGGTSKYQLAAEMLRFPNVDDLKPNAWIPRGLASHIAFNWKMQNAFWKAETLVDALAATPGTFDVVLKNIKEDPKGPRVDLPTEIIANLEERAVIMTDNRLPISPKSERLMFCVKIKNPEIVSNAVDKAMSNDPEAKERSFEGYKFWEIINDESESFTQETDGSDPFDEFGDGLDAGGFGDDDDDDEDSAPDQERADIPNSAVVVAHGYLIIASHVDFVEDMLKQVNDREKLAAAADFNEVQNALEKMGAGADSFRYFTRTDEAYRPTYELTQQGKMPQSETLLGKLLNRILTTADDAKAGVTRKQQIDGSKMPDFQMVRRYLGPGGAYVRTQDEGWYIEGCLLKK